MDLAAPGRNEDERPALIYRNDPEVAKATAAAPPLARPMLFMRMVKALALVRGSPGRLIFPISAQHVQALLRMTGLSVNQRIG